MENNSEIYELKEKLRIAQQSNRLLLNRGDHLNKKNEKLISDFKKLDEFVDKLKKRNLEFQEEVKKLNDHIRFLENHNRTLKQCLKDVL